MQRKSKFRIWLEDLLTQKYKIAFFCIIFVCSFIINLYASQYVDRIPTTATGDLILNNIPTLDLRLLFVYGFLAVIVTIVIYTTIFKIKESSYVLWQFSLIILMRSFFIVLTHLGLPTDGIMPADLPSFYQSLHFENDLFFSGHTATPFLAYLLFRKEKIAPFFLIMTLVLAVTVLLMHVHYSIDVFGAIFITFGTYTFGEWAHNKMSATKK